MTRGVLIFTIAVLGGSPALAAPSCIGSGGTFPIGADDVPSETLQIEQDLANLRTRGIEALTAERTSLECIRITRREDGVLVTEYYDPSSFKQVE
jgi:hypothetical protein